MNCTECTSKRVVLINAKCSDACLVSMPSRSPDQQDGYAPYDMNIGGGDYLKLGLCLNCGHVQGEWPVPPTDFEQEAEAE